MLSKHLATPNRVFDFICQWILPLGFVLLLCALFFLPGRSQHHKLFYGLFSIPTLIALCLRPSTLKELIREPIFIAFALFAGWALISVSWAPETESIARQVKVVLHTTFLFAGCYLLVRYRSDLLHPLLFGAASVALLASLYNLYRFGQVYQPGMRLIGAGALDNPLLSSHLYGFFCVYWLSLSMLWKNRQILWLTVPAALVMFTAVVATGSRTPLVALAAAAIWIGILCWNRRSIALFGLLIGGGVAVGVLFSGMILARGNSYRFEIWQIVLREIAQHPWLGHGYGADLAVDPGIGFMLAEPHNFALGVLYYVGIIGFLPWLFFQAWGLLSSWRYRVQPFLVMASTWLIYGMGAGLTEGGGILSRPKEHWFLLWIPLALIAALSINYRARRLLNIPVQKLSPQALEGLTCDAQVIESDGLGPKVLRLAGGDFLKLFRARRWYTSGGFNPYSERFAVNSQQLRNLGIPSPTILNLYYLNDGSSAVHYVPLPGMTLRQALQSTSTPAQRHALVEGFGKFMAQLHERGVYFRSLHLGNVLVLDNGEFGLIDIADLYLYPSALRLALRQRNLRHLQRYPEDQGWLFEQHLDALLNGYAMVASKPAVDNLHKRILSGSNPAQA
ncbi:bifunctional O-antigen ligase/aminoglycoside phosphotransferase family protein [Pseudomonas brassicacearum]|uniref:bifunctional O-antigen ligase/aminoglycoside phosphotransferase family protein n=1 Tax=Pseudomonas brassicacearum TaxID=930166 RepID=UPI00046D1D21|nr:bifunctional O-antigen ligase/aminoglycoside phosphotransferase family protein [Pseudomonas brassicacearum]